MKNIITDLKKIVNNLEKYNSYDTNIFDPVFQKIKQVSKAWSGSLLGYHACVYYENFNVPPKGAKFSQEWGINNPIVELDSFNILGGSVGSWIEYTYEEVIEYINQKAGILDLSQVIQDSNDSRKIIEDAKDDVLLIINARGLLNNDEFLSKLIKDIEKTIIPTKEDFLKNNFSKKISFSTKDSRVENKILYPPHLILESSIYEIVACFSVIKTLEKGINKVIKYLLTKSKGKKMVEVSNNKLSNQIFIVHGHDNNLKTEVARFVEKLGFEAIILHEKASAGKTIIEKIEHYSDVSFGIVLYTECDIGGKNKDVLKSRARQNVVFEHGYLIGKIGRKNVVALVKGDIEKPNDISGVVYIDVLSNWQIDLVKEMKEIGYTIDIDKLL